MYSSRCNCSNDNMNGCNRNGERILVNQGCGCDHSRRRCACQNTFRPGCGNHQGGCNQNQGCHNSCGCGNHNCGCGNNNNCSCGNQSCGCGNKGCGCRPKPCPPRPCPPRPCPPKRPTCEDRCRAQYRECLRNCRYQEDEDNRIDACDFDFDFDE